MKIKNINRLKKMMLYLLVVAVMTSMMVMPVSAASSSYNMNVSLSHVSNSSGKLPSTASKVSKGDKAYFNFVVTDKLKIKSATVYVKESGAKDYSKVDTEKANNYFRYVYLPYTFKKVGTANYYWKYTDTSGKEYKTKTGSVKIVKGSPYEQKVKEFTSDKRWKDGISWNGSQTPKLSGHQAWGCCAYAADFVKYVFGKSKQSAGTSFTGVSNIRTGDVLELSPQHWIVVLERNGNTLKTAEGNASSKVQIKTGKYKISGNKLKTEYSGSYSLVKGYHYIK